jgi:hypothetical protein
MTMAEQLYEVSSKLPPPALAELLDFAEFLRQKCTPPSPAQHGSLAALMGGLEDSSTFAGTPMAIQEKMRREWD